MIRRVSIDGYKSLRDVNLEPDRLTVVFGPNAAGKSNLFDALRLLGNSVTSRNLPEAFEQHRGDPLEAFDLTDGGLQALLARERAAFHMEVDVELDDHIVGVVEDKIRAQRSGLSEDAETVGTPKRRVTERLLRYGLRVELVPKTGVLRVRDEYLLALRQGKGELQPSAARSAFLERHANRLRLRREGQSGRPMEYELGLDCTVVSQPLYAPHYPHVAAFREELASWRFHYFEPTSMREESPLKEATELGISGADLPAFFHTQMVNNERQFDNTRKVLKTIIPAVEGIEIEITEEGKLRLQIRENGVSYSAKVTSEGTLRMLGLLAILSPGSRATTVGFEEPENGVHPRRLKIIADLLRNASQHRQIIVNTHSPLLVDYLAAGRLVRCVKRQGHTVFERLDQLPLFQKKQVEDGLEEPEVSRRILRGDFDD
jgi:predicted ATPase